MTLEEMLQYVGSEFLDDRTDLVEGDADELWSDAYLVRQFNEAQRIMARRAWVIIEYGRSPAGLITLQTGRALYPLHESVLRVYDATPATQLAPLGRAEDANIRDPNGVASGPFSAYETGEYAARSAGTNAAYPLVFASDAASRTIRVSPTPIAAQNGVRVALKIARLPLCELALNDTRAEPEVPAEFHMAICEFAAGKALTLPNIDGDQKPEGRRLLGEFDRVVREARQERQRAERGSNRWEFSSTTAVLGRG
jgi:hypothetical protein